MNDANVAPGSRPPDGPEPGWYLDPWDPARLRWWDGQSWTGTSAVRDAPGSGGAWGTAVGTAGSSYGAYGAPWVGGASAAVQVEEQRSKARRARLALTAAPVLLAIQYVSNGAQLRHLADAWPDFEAIDRVDTNAGAAIASQLAGAAMIGVYVVFLIWFYGAATTAVALRIPARRSPGWAIGGWFIPIVNLWFPYQSAKGMLPLGDPGVSVLRRWWASWIATQLVGIVVVGTAFGPRWLLGVGVTVAGLVGAVSAWAARIAIETVTSTHERLARGGA